MRKDYKQSEQICSLIIFVFFLSSVFSNLPHSSKRAKVSGYSLKVTLASLEKGKVKNATRQIYVMITEETANVPHVTVKCQEELGIAAEIKLVTANGLPLEDSAGTRGNWYSYSKHHCSVLEMMFLP